MFKVIKNHKLLFLVLLLATILRLWSLANNPPHLTSDELGIGYNAYSILKTGRDEHGQIMPAIFESFGDWKPGLYIYLSVPFIALLGLNEFAVRLPGAIFGISAVWFIYLVAGEIFESKRRSKVQIAAAFLLAISPWHVHFSRGAWETQVSLSLALLGIYFFLRAVKGEHKLILISVALFALTLWTYQGAKLATAIIVLGLAIFFYRSLVKLPGKVIAQGFLIGFLISLPIVVSMFEGKVGRLTVFSVFSYQRPENQIQKILDQGDITKDSWQYFLYHSEPLGSIRGVLDRWTYHLSGVFLFFKGDGSNVHTVPDGGMLLVADGTLFIAGLIFLARLGIKKEALFLWFWFFLSPLPSALSRDSANAVRSFNMVAPVTIILALGAISLLSWVKKRGKVVKFAGLCFVLFYIANFVYFLDRYWVHLPIRSSQDWGYDYKQMAKRVVSLKGDYTEVVVQQSYRQPYIHFLFYQKYDPQRYQSIAADVFVPSEYGDVGLVSKLDNITFRPVNWSADRQMSGKLFVVNPIDVPESDLVNFNQFKLIEPTLALDGTTVFYLFGVR